MIVIMQDPDWNHLKIVLAIARAGSLTGAARHLGVDQTTTGRRLTTLEHQLGKTLFVRAKSGFVPTEDGHIVIEAASKLEADVARMADALSDAEDGVSGVVRILGNPWMLERFAANGLMSLLARHPNLQIKLSGRLPPNTIHGEATVSLWFDAPAQAPDITLPFARVPYAVYRSKRLHSAPRDWVQFHDDDARGPSFTRQIMQKVGPDAQVRLTATDASILLAAVRSGAANGILPTCLAELHEDLMRIDAKDKPLQRVLHAQLNAGTANTRRMKTVLNWLHKTVKPALNGESLPFNLSKISTSEAG